MSLEFDMSGLVAQFDKARKIKSRVMKKALNYFVLVTPIRTGYARHHTSLKSDVITADYPYAGRLDEGYSKQSPRGMTGPTEKMLEKLIKDELKGIK